MRHLVVGLAFLLVACDGPGLDGVFWKCTAQSDCGEGFVCSTRRGACIKPESDAPGVSPTKISVVMTGPLATGPTSLGRGMRDGIESWFSEVNAQGGVDGRQLELKVLDDGYDPTLTQSLVEGDLAAGQAFAIIGSAGFEGGMRSAAAGVNAHIPVLGAASGSMTLRTDPPDRYVFNLRAGLDDEIYRAIGFLTTVRQPDVAGKNISILVEAKDGTPTAYGQSVLDLVRSELRTQRDIMPTDVGFQLGERESKDVDQAVGGFLKWLGSGQRTKDEQGEIDAVIILASTYGPSAALIEALLDEVNKIKRGVSPGLEFNLTNAEVSELLNIRDVQFLLLSSVGFNETVAELDQAGTYESLTGERRYCADLLSTQVVPLYTGSATGLLEYRRNLMTHRPDALPGFVSLEGYLAARLFVEALYAHGPSLSLEPFVDTLERLDGIDLGVGGTYAFSPSQHEASDRVYGVSTDVNCALNAYDLGEPGEPQIPDPMTNECVNGVCIITGTLTQDKTLTADKRWLLRGTVFIGDGTEETVLTIQPGTTIVGEKSTTGVLVIRRSSKIQAAGTREQPIVFTSDQPTGSRASGDWGGLILNGKGRLNTCPDQSCEAFGEGGTGFFGGDNDADDSGELSYVRIEFGGKLYSPENELNGLALQAVGSATRLEYIQIHLGKDDGVEFFGGAANFKHILVTGSDDDNLDFTDGWRGKGQFFIAQQYPGFGNNGIEADNSEFDFVASPRTKPTLSNLTFIGSPDSTFSDNGMLLRRGTGANIHNTIVAGFNDNCINIDTPETFAAAVTSTDTMTLSGELTLSNSIIDCVTPFKEDVADLFRVSDFFMVLNSGNQIASPMLRAPFSITDRDFRPMPGSPAATGAVMPADPFFDVVPYKGGMDPTTDWTAGWTTNVQN